MKKILILFISILMLTSCTDYVKKQAEADKQCKILVHQIDSLRNLRDNCFYEVDSLKALINFIQSNQESRERNDRLIAERKSIENDIRNKTNLKNSLQNKNDNLTHQVNANNFALSCRNTIYIVKIKIHQTTYTLDIEEHIKNHLNDVEFEIPVDKGYYDNCHIGQDVTNAGLKLGSFLRDGDFSKLKIRITNKRTMKRSF